MAGKGEALAALANLSKLRGMGLKLGDTDILTIVSALTAPLEGDGWELPAGPVSMSVPTGRLTVSGDWVRDGHGDYLTVDMALEELNWGGALAETPQVRQTAIPASKPFQVLGTSKVVQGQKLKLMTGRDCKGKYHTLMTVDPPEGLRAIDEYDKCVLAAVCSIVETRGGYDANGTLDKPLVVPIASIFRTMCGTNQPSQNQRTQVIESLAKLKFTPVMIDARHERGEGWEGTGGLEGIIEGKITWDYADEGGTVAECLTLHEAPAFLMHAKRLGQIISVNPRLLAGDGSSSNTRRNIMLRSLLLQRVDIFSQKGGEYSVIRITRSPAHPDVETVFERAEFDMSKQKQRGAAIEEAKKYLEFLRREGLIGGFETLNESGERPTERGRGATRAYIKLHGTRRRLGKASQ